MRDKHEQFLDDLSDARASTLSFSRRSLLKLAAGVGVAGANLSLLGDALAASSPEEVTELTIHLQAGLDKILVKHANPAFAKIYPKVQLLYDAGANAKTYPKMLAERRTPSVAGGTFNDVYAVRGGVDKMWAPFDPSLVPNAKKIPEAILVGGKGLGIPVHLCPYGIMYNPDLVEEPKSWADLWNPKYKQKVGMYTTYYDAYLMAAKAAGMDPTVENGIAAWEPHRTNIGAWNSSSTLELDMVSRGEIWMAPHWGAWCEVGRAAGKKVAFTIPKEGATQWTDYLQLTSGVDENVSKATQVLFNLLLGPEVQQA